MNRKSIAIIIWMFAAAFAAVGGEVQTFTDKASGRSIDATIVGKSEDGESVVLMLRNGKRYTVKISKLDEVSADYVKEWKSPHKNLDIRVIAARFARVSPYGRRYRDSRRQYRGGPWKHIRVTVNGGSEPLRMEVVDLSEPVPGLTPPPRKLEIPAREPFTADFWVTSRYKVAVWHGDKLIECKTDNDKKGRAR
jgi:hypothetical protein